MKDDWILNFRDYLQADQPQPVQLLETHISWVLLSGDYAYKIKKPVDFGFLDFSRLEQRKLYCEAEIELNRPLAPSLYLAAVPIYGSPSAPTLQADDAAMAAANGPPQPFEYAVKMVAFDPEQLLTLWLAPGQVSPDQLLTVVDTLGYLIADFHGRAQRAPEGSDYGSVEAVWQPVEDNFASIEPLLHRAEDRAALAQLRAWLQTARRRLASMLAARRAGGFVRACHGDLHSGNIAMIDGEPVPFDCIEFNDRLRFIDVLGDLAFLTMDLHHHGRADLANRLLNRYLEYGGDYAALPLLDFYQCYRAMVRAKISLLRLQQVEAAGDDAATVDAVLADYRGHIGLAQSFTQARPVFLLIMHGVSGTGKTTVARQICAATGAIHLRSDVQRKRLFGLKPLQSSESLATGSIYTNAASAATFARLEQLAAALLRDRFSVVVDATFLHQFAREPFRLLAQRHDTPFAIVSCQLGDQQLQRRLQARARRRDDASEADVEVMLRQLDEQEPFTAAEQPCVLRQPGERAGFAAALGTFLAPFAELTRRRRTVF